MTVERVSSSSGILFLQCRGGEGGDGGKRGRNTRSFLCWDTIYIVIPLYNSLFLNYRPNSKYMCPQKNGIKMRVNRMKMKSIYRTEAPTL